MITHNNVKFCQTKESYASNRIGVGKIIQPIRVHNESKTIHYQLNTQSEIVFFVVQNQNLSFKNSKNSRLVVTQVHHMMKLTPMVTRFQVFNSKGSWN